MGLFSEVSRSGAVVGDDFETWNPEIGEAQGQRRGVPGRGPSGSGCAPVAAEG